MLLFPGIKFVAPKRVRTLAGPRPAETESVSRKVLVKKDVVVKVFLSRSGIKDSRPTFFTCMTKIATRIIIDVNTINRKPDATNPNKAIENPAIPTTRETIEILMIFLMILSANFLVGSLRHLGNLLVSFAIKTSISFALFLRIFPFSFF